MAKKEQSQVEEIKENEEVKPQEVKEEVKKEVKPTPRKENNPDESRDIKRFDNAEEVADQIEVKRRALLALFNKSKLISRITMIITVAAVIGAIILIFNQEMVLKIIGYSLAGAVLVGMIIYYAISKDKFPRASKEYINSVTDLINGYDFTDSRFTDLKVYPYKKLDKTELEVDRVYKNSTEIGSRNFIAGKFDGHSFEVSENVLYIVSGQKRMQRSVAFLGKYISIPNEKKFEGRYIFNIKGNPEKLVDQPSDIEDLKVVLEEENLVVYAPNEKPLKEVFGTKFMSKLKEIKTDDKLLNFVIVVWAGHTAVYLSYDDSVTVLPFEHEFNRAAQDKYKEDLIASLELATLK